MYCMIFLWILGLFVSSCRSTDIGSQVQSLSHKELESCEFNGKRFMLMLAPGFADADVVPLKELFVKFISKNQLARLSYFQQSAAGDGHKAEQCERYFLEQVSQYQLFDSLTQKLATVQLFKDRLANIRQQILNQRMIDPNREIQILVTHSGHGDNLQLQYPDGVVIFADGSLPFGDYGRLIYENLMTKCGLSNCSKPRERLADEVIIFMDTCYSGNFNDKMRTYLSGQAYPLDLDYPTDSKATRLFSVTSSDLNHTSAGNLAGTKSGTITHFLTEIFNYWNGDRLTANIGNGDGKISLGEIERYFNETWFMRFSQKTVDSLRGLNSSLICHPFDREIRLGEMRTSSQFVKDLYDNPMKALSSDTHKYGRSDKFATGLTLQNPTIFSNLSKASRENIFMAVRGPGDPLSEQGNHQLSMLTDKNAILARTNEIKALVEVLKALETYFKIPGNIEKETPPQPGEDGFVLGSHLDLYSELADCEEDPFAGRDGKK